MTSLVNAFVEKIIANSDYQEIDSLYLHNRILALVGEDGVNKESSLTDLIELKEALLQVAVANGKVGTLTEEKDCLGAELMNFITPAPSKVNQDFWQTYGDSPTQAIADFYRLSKANDYIKVAAIAKNIAYQVPSAYGDIEITINLSKPEKDPKAIAAAKKVKASSYPKCQLCMENEGYQGRIDYPARANHRIIHLDLLGQEWGFQYSPYAYFNEHCIFLDRQHIPMQITRRTFEQLLEIVDKFPGYFAGSNSDLPIVGGSILTHNHYQGGRHVFPMEKAELDYTFYFKDFPDIKAGIVKWPMSVIRLTGKNKSRLVALAEEILQAWRHYSDPKVDVVAFSQEGSHHTVTPIARKRNSQFELDIVLRDNHTSDQYPDGVYHPHADVQHIKKENIGLIEVMGLAILPPRLKEELVEVENYLINQYNEIADYHKTWADELKSSVNVSVGNVHQVVQHAVGQVFVRVLEDAGVYKRNPDGQLAFRRFLETIGID
ncbi:galactose-1-phosphate uridylyltransferase [Streptococcus criceti]|uniref:Galactose-1-phosphate uridylyltransferase n=1 Tax=Streptococcus criceti HS-6 TaxID=873449 RepID=G5JTX6_STRCG|nr:UDP-glucose--hexose-1-phosphate uridylyltransferase [Streptococcus criceti]EHI74682.1 putative UTP--hexose-1-phosphate uridylyltransferase [Streptococcus criceti HS-6]SUN37790.1 galactose-1-phosphate uridylyltransferase [Streptococcus criceti]